jgi:nitrite reductase/ring-hydroxylating ferredoxin subunit
MSSGPDKDPHPSFKRSIALLTMCYCGPIGTKRKTWSIQNFFLELLIDLLFFGKNLSRSNYCFGREESQMGSDYISVIKADEIKEDSMKLVTVVGRSVLLIKHGGQVYGVSNRCPHMGCSLAAGKLKEYIITCPCHGWNFDVRNGQYQNNKAIKLMAYECKIENGKVYVKLFDDF